MIRALLCETMRTVRLESALRETLLESAYLERILELRRSAILTSTALKRAP
jgi:hypothetical protein